MDSPKSVTTAVSSHKNSDWVDWDWYWAAESFVSVIPGNPFHLFMPQVPLHVFLSGLIDTEAVISTGTLSLFMQCLAETQPKTTLVEVLNTTPLSGRKLSVRYFSLGLKNALKNKTLPTSLFRGGFGFYPKHTDNSEELKPEAIPCTQKCLASIPASHPADLRGLVGEACVGDTLLGLAELRVGCDGRVI